jgi:hypothetical protein
MRTYLGIGLLVLSTLGAFGDVLIVADEFPAMEVLAKRLRTDGKTPVTIVDQQGMPTPLAAYTAVVVYIHRDLAAAAERAFIEYAEGGGRLVLLHHSISSGKRRNRDWFTFLGVDLPPGDPAQGGYKWIEGVTADWFRAANGHYVMTNQVSYPGTVLSSTAGGNSGRTLPAFTLHDTEVYLNHVLKGGHTVLMGLKYTDAAGKTWVQETAGWYRGSGKGVVCYLMPGHSPKDFEDPTYAQIVVNAVLAQPDAFSGGK